MASKIMELGKHLPTPYLRELYYDWNKMRNSNTEAPLPNTIVERFFINLHTQDGRAHDPIALEAIRFHRFYTHQFLEAADLERISWYYNGDPNHICT